ncbi:MAG TPA: Gfo/Idh/MocA family oxidoreductase [Acidimicrobiia bacterium]|jgi:myo-inositol 2-dehydrogenase/D-chiro-inositol 1-dehydrogenase|nr:Gfo/Idh/MocA family oxidoreductase [Acidimicrobiia bacterium]
MQLGLIGAGRIGAVHLGTLSDMGSVEAVFVSDAVPDRAAALAAGHEVATASTLEAMFEAADAVIIASPTDTHAAMLERAAVAGIPAFCEKPIALDLESTRRAVAAVDDAGIVVQMGFQRRYDPAIKKIRDQVVSGDLGTVYLVRSQTHDHEPPPLDYLRVSGGIFKDCLVHDIDTVRYVTGQEVVSVRAAGTVVAVPEIGALGDVDTAAVVMEMSGGSLAQLSALRHDPLGYDVRLEVFGARDSVAAGWSARTPIRSAEPDTPAEQDPITTWLERFGAAFRAELDAFVRVVAGDESPASTAHDAYEDLRVATACDISLAENRTVLLEEIA